MAVDHSNELPLYVSRPQQDALTGLQNTFILAITISVVLGITISCIALHRLRSILTRPRPPKTRAAPFSTSSTPTHLLIVLGSGGHTAEMLNILSNIPDLARKFSHRTYLISSGDGFSAMKAKIFEEELAKKMVATEQQQQQQYQKRQSYRSVYGSSSYSTAMVHRARKIHQPLYTTPWSALLCLWDCIQVLQGTHRDLVATRSPLGTSNAGSSAPGYPDLILTNGPGTGVCVVVAALILLLLGFSGPSNNTASSSSFSSSSDVQPRFAKREQDLATPEVSSGQMRTLYIESWARVKTLSLSGKILKFLVDRFLVQWPDLAEREGGKVEYVGPLVT